MANNYNATGSGFWGHDWLFPPRGSHLSSQSPPLTQFLFRQSESWMLSASRESWDGEKGEDWLLYLDKIKAFTRNVLRGNRASLHPSCVPIKINDEDSLEMVQGRKRREDGSREAGGSRRSPGCEGLTQRAGEHADQRPLWRSELAPRTLGSTHQPPPPLASSLGSSGPPSSTKPSWAKLSSPHPSMLPPHLRNVSRYLSLH